MARTKLAPIEGQMTVGVRDVPCFPGEQFRMGFPEAIGDASRPVWFGGITPTWEEREAGAWECSGTLGDEVFYSLSLTPGEDLVHVAQRVTNLSGRTWEQSLAFNCFGCGGAPSVRDHECLRHYVGLAGKVTRLIEVPRVFSPRPTVQLYSVEGAPPGAAIPFVSAFAATPEDVTLEPWMAIASRDATRLVAVVSKPALFLFQNMEYSCIHSASSFGRLKPGETGEAVTRVYFVHGTVEQWRERMLEEMGWGGEQGNGGEW